ncbi:MAG: exodeoxyribonuclease V subunit gamma [Alcanivoracaceae bacterium]
MENGFAIIHANRLEDLTALTVDWIKGQPLPPLVDDVFLVESNGIAQWLRLALADDTACGIAAAQQFQMPSRFLWQAYRSVLGEDQVPHTSPFDKSRLVWRLMRLLPTLSTDEAYLPLARFLADDTDLRKHYQLSERLADLYDQYQVYRADWLTHWEQGHDSLPQANADSVPLNGQRWQARLWRLLRDDMPADQRDTSRASIHARFLKALEQNRIAGALPPRIIVFGISALPQQTLEALHALSGHCQILLLAQNPSEHYWGDIVEDRELLRRQQQRHAGKPSLAGLSADELSMAANPLLASWGKQGRDYINLLYSYDVPERYQDWFQSIDVFSPPHPQDDASAPLLRQVQQDIFSLANTAVGERRMHEDGDDSLSFHVAHSRQREVEVLHDQLLDLFEKDSALKARDIIVMVPDIQSYAPHVEAVFGGIAQDDPRHIPYTLSDRSQQHTLPLAGALAQLLNAPTLRFTVSDILDLLDVAAIRQRFGIAVSDLPLVRQWAAAAGIRWGFDAGHRASLQLPEHLAHNSWLFGLERMLLGYATGDAPAWQAIEPFDEVAGLSARLAGQLAAFIQVLQKHWQQLSQDGTPAQWRERLTQLLDDIALVEDETDAQLQASVIDALEQWQLACDEAAFSQAVPVSIARAVLLRTLDQGSLSQRFLAGQVNFCTLMPMRSIPFRVVCLLGMNDGDYPRSQLPMDFDLMAMRGQYRPGDRSRREDDRYLFLEALLSARQKLYISWVGRNIRDNSPSPASVLVGQLRDYLAQGWTLADASSGDILDALTIEHPLQPFSRDYFRSDAATGRLFTYAHEWREALEPRDGSGPDNLPLPQTENIQATPGEVARFLRDPVALFFNERLKVRALNTDSGAMDDEPFALDALTSTRINGDLLDAGLRAIDNGDDVTDAINREAARLCATGQLPPPPWDSLHADALTDEVGALAMTWQQALQHWPDTAEPIELRLDDLAGPPPFAIEGWLKGLRSGPEGLCQLLPFTGDIDKKPWRLVNAWVDHLCGCATGLKLHSWLLNAEKSFQFQPLDALQARHLLEHMAQAWLQALQMPLPLAVRTGFECMSGKTPNLKKAQSAYEGGFNHTGERDYTSNLLLRRSFPDFDTLVQAHTGDEPLMVHWAERLYVPLLAQRSTLDIGGRQ